MSSYPSKLQSELKKRQPFESVAQEAWLNLVRTTSQLQIQFERLFASHGLTSSQYNILRILRGEGKPLPILEIAHRMIVVVPGITGLIDRLEKAGMVTRERCLQDRRVIYISITDVATRLLSQLDHPVSELHDSTMQPLTKADQRQLVHLLEKLRAGHEVR